jgi:DNA-binding NarL/FixJ family response regulator
MKILVTDDHPIMRDALKITLGAIVPEAEIFSTGKLDEAVALGRQHTPDLIILDLGLPEHSGIEALTRLREALPEARVVVFSGADNRAVVIAALDAGAMGFIPKTAASSVLISALRLVLAGGIYVPPEAVNFAENASPPRPAPRAEDYAALTPRQREVMQLMLMGHSNKAICKHLSISENTVKVHVSAVLRALGAENRTQAVLAASKLGIQLPPVAE